MSSSIRVDFYLLIFTLIFGLSGCGENSPTRIWNAQDIRPEKSQEALESCSRLSIPKDIALSGQFLYFYPRCMQDAVGEGPLMSLLQMQDLAGGPATMEDMATVLRYEISDGVVEKKRPLLKTFALLFSEPRKDLWTSMLNLSDTINPRQIVNWGLGQAKQGELKKWIQDSLPLLSASSWPTLSGEIKGWLSNVDYRNAMSFTLKQFFSHESYNDVANWLRPESSVDVLREGRDETLKSWLDPLSPQEIPVSKQTQNLPTTEEKISGPKRWSDFWSSLTENEKSQINTIIGDVVNETASWDESRREAFLWRLGKGGESLFERQGNPLGHLVALVHLTRSSKVAEITPLLQALGELIEQPSAMVPLNKKLASFDLAVYLAEQLSVPNVELCPGLELPALKLATSSRSFKQGLVYWMSPNDLCGHGVSPISLLLQTYIDQRLKCKEAPPKNDDDPERYCLNANDWKMIQESEQKIASKLPRHFLMTSVSSDNQHRLSFLSYLWSNIAHDLEKNAWALHSLNLSLGPVSVQDWNNWGAEVIATNGDISELAKLQSIWGKSYHNLLGENFIERLARWGLTQAGAELSGIDKIWGDYQDQAYFPQILGLSAGGFWDQIITSQFNAESLPVDVRSTFPGPIRELDDILSRVKIPGAIYRDYSRSADDQELDFKFLGPSKLSVSFKSFQGTDFIGLKSSGQVPLKLDSILDLNKKEGLARPAELLKGDLVTREIPGDGHSAQLASNWFRETLLPRIGASSYWQDKWESFQLAPAMAQELAEEIEYPTLLEIRANFLLMMRSYLVAPGLLPEKGKYEMAKHELINKQYLSWPSNTKFGQTYRQLVPIALGENGDQNETPTQLFNRLWKIGSWEEYHSLFQQNLWPTNFEPQGVEDFVQNNTLAAQTIKLLGSLFLLTTNKADQLQPLIGDRAWCWGADQSSLDCPIVLTGQTEEEKYIELTRYVKAQFLLSFCPLLEASQANDTWSKQLLTYSHLDLNDMDLFSTCSLPGVNLLHQAYAIRGTKKELVFEKKNIIPVKSISYQLVRAIHWGANPQLHSAIESLSFDLAWERRLKYPKSKFSSAQNRPFADLSLPFHLPKMEDKFQRIISENHGFYTGLPDLIGQIVANNGTIFPNPTVWQNRLNRIGAGTLPGEDPNKGKIYQFVREFVLDPAQDPSRQDESVISFLFSRLSYLTTHPESKNILVGMLGRISDYEGLESLAKAVPLYLRSFEDDFDWSRNDLFFTKQLLRRDLQRSATDFLSALGDDGTQWLIDLAIKVGENVPEIGQSYPNKLVDWICTQSLSGQMEYFIIQGQKAIKKLVVDESLRSDSSIREMSKLIAFLNTSQTDFFGRSLPGGNKKIEHLVSIFAEYLPASLDHYAQVKSPDDFFRSSVESLVLPLANPENERWLPAVVNFASEAQLPGVSSVWSKLMGQSDIQDSMQRMGAGLDNVPLAMATKALRSTKYLLSRTQKVLSFLRGKLQWAPGVSSDITESFDQMVWLAGDGLVVIDQQIDMLEKWGSVNGR